MNHPLRLLDLFCGAGGCAVGYSRAGFEVVGIDNRPQPRYPFEFHQMDWLAGLERFAGEVDVIHASPPCQAYSRARHTPGAKGRKYPNLLPDVLRRLSACDEQLLWVVENVPGAPMPPFSIMLCGTMFGLRVRRHRLFYSSCLLLTPSNECRHRAGDLTIFGHCVQVTGSRGVAYKTSSGRTHYRPLRVGADAGKQAMGCEWMNRCELSESIPPAYTHYLGKQLLAVLLARQERESA